MAEHSGLKALTDEVARVLAAEQERLGHESDAVTMANIQARAVVEHLGVLGMPVEAAGSASPPAAQFLVQCSLVDRVRLYAAGLGPAPVVPGEFTVAAQRLWVSPGGQAVAHQWSDLGQTFVRLSTYRERLCQGTLAAEDLDVARRDMARLLRWLIQMVEAATRREASAVQARPDVTLFEGAQA